MRLCVALTSTGETHDRMNVPLSSLSSRMNVPLSSPVIIY